MKPWVCIVKKEVRLGGESQRCRHVECGEMEYDPAEVLVIPKPWPDWALESIATTRLEPNVRAVSVNPQSGMTQGSVTTHADPYYRPARADEILDALAAAQESQ